MNVSGHELFFSLATQTSQRFQFPGEKSQHLLSYIGTKLDLGLISSCNLSIEDESQMLVGVSGFFSGT